MLAIDTATEVTAIALAVDGNYPAAESAIESGRSHLEMLLPEVFNLLEESSLSIGDISAIVVGIGPGTFSGLRVGIATARALAQTLEVPLTGFSTLEALALELAGGITVSDSSLILPLIDAKRGQVFARLYRKEGKNQVRPESEILCLSPERLLETLSAAAYTRIRAGGNGAVVHHDALNVMPALDLLATDDPGNRMRAVWHLQAAKENAQFEPRRLLAVTPLYVREPDADKTILLRKKDPWRK